MELLDNFFIERRNRQVGNLSAGGATAQNFRQLQRLQQFPLGPSGQALYFEGSYEGVRNLWRVEVEPQTLRWIAGPERLTTDPGPDTEIAISPDGKKLAYTIRTERTRIWSLPFNATTA